MSLTDETRVEDKKNIVVVTIKSWNVGNFRKIEKELEGYNWTLMEDKEDLTYERLKELDPAYVFFPHWSWIIPKDIYENFECVVFHMTDLPFGRGGSPLQNLISRGIYKTKISAIRVVRGLDAGDIYMKRDLDLSRGSAEEIFKKASEIIYNMMAEIIRDRPAQKKQEGEVVEFKRRTPEESRIPDGAPISKVHDWIRMLDGEGYPPAFIETGGIRMEFSNSRLSDGKVRAHVTIKVMEDEEKQ